MAKKESQSTIRFPLVGNYNTRLFLSGGSFTNSCIVGVAVVGLCVVGTGAGGATQDQRFINAIMDRIVTPITENVKYYIYKRPGLETHTTPAAGNIGTALAIWTGKGTGGDVISAFGATNSTIYNGTTSIGTITGVARDITETVVGTVPNLVIPVDNSRLYFYPEGGAMTQVTDADYPGQAGFTTTGTCVHINNRVYIMTTDGKIWNSDLNSISSWSATSFISSGIYPDRGVGLSRYKNHIVAFNKESIEFFEDVGNPLGSPLRRHTTNEGSIRIGALSETTIAQVEDNLVWISSSNSGGISIYMLDDYKPVRISDNVMDNKLGLTGGGAVYLTAAKLGGKTLFFVIHGSQCYVYCVEDKMWHEWAAGGGTILWHKFAASTAASSIVHSISRTSTSGKVYKINPVSPVYMDDGLSYDWIVQTSKIDFGTEKRKFLNRLTVVGDSDILSHLINISWSDDDYTTYNADRSIDLASNRKYLSNCGYFRRRNFKITDSTSRPIRLEALELDVKEGLR